MKAKLLIKLRKRFKFVPVDKSGHTIEMLDTQTNTIYARWRLFNTTYDLTVIGENYKLHIMALSILLEKPYGEVNGELHRKREIRRTQFHINELKKWNT